MLFMKGNKMFPQCGFSNTAVTILKSIVPADNFETFDVLSDEEVNMGIQAFPDPIRARPRARPRARASPTQVRAGIKTYSNWPTIPQCYIDGEFIGGCDLMIEMYQSGELQEMVERAIAS